MSSNHYKPITSKLPYSLLEAWRMRYCRVLCLGGRRKEGVCTFVRRSYGEVIPAFPITPVFSCAKDWPRLAIRCRCLRQTMHSAQLPLEDQVVICERSVIAIRGQATTVLSCFVEPQVAQYKCITCAWPARRMLSISWTPNRH